MPAPQTQAIPAYPGARFSTLGYCLSHPSIQLCQPTPNGKYKIVRKTCFKCGSAGLITSTKGRGQGIHGYRKKETNVGLERRSRWNGLLTANSNGNSGTSGGKSTSHGGSGNSSSMGESAKALQALQKEAAIQALQQEGLSKRFLRHESHNSAVSQGSRGSRGSRGRERTREKDEEKKKTVRPPRTRMFQRHNTVHPMASVPSMHPMPSAANVATTATMATPGPGTGGDANGSSLNPLHRARTLSPLRSSFRRNRTLSPLRRSMSRSMSKSWRNIREVMPGADHIKEHKEPKEQTYRNEQKQYKEQNQQKEQKNLKRRDAREDKESGRDVYKGEKDKVDKADKADKSLLSHHELSTSLEMVPYTKSSSDREVVSEKATKDKRDTNTASNANNTKLIKVNSIKGTAKIPQSHAVEHKLGNSKQTNKQSKQTSFQRASSKHAPKKYEKHEKCEKRKSRPQDGDNDGIDGDSHTDSTTCPSSPESQKPAFSSDYFSADDALFPLELYPDDLNGLKMSSTRSIKSSKSCATSVTDATVRHSNAGSDRGDRSDGSGRGDRSERSERSGSRSRSCSRSASARSKDKSQPTRSRSASKDRRKGKSVKLGKSLFAKPSREEVAVSLKEVEKEMTKQYSKLCW